jgi:hypothetical protein
MPSPEIINAEGWRVFQTAGISIFSGNPYRTSHWFRGGEDRPACRQGWSRRTTRGLNRGFVSRDNTVRWHPPLHAYQCCPCLVRLRRTFDWAAAEFA